MKLESKNIMKSFVTTSINRARFGNQYAPKSALAITPPLLNIVLKATCVV